MGDISSNRLSSAEISTPGSPSKICKENYLALFSPPSHVEPTLLLLDKSWKEIWMPNMTVLSNQDLIQWGQTGTVSFDLKLTKVNRKLRHQRYKDSLLVDSLSNGWTDEKHISFLNSIEASFVNQFYNDQCHSKDFLGWLSRINKHKVSSEHYENDPKPGQFKVLRKGCWENLRFERDNDSGKMNNGSFPLSSNPWIQRFRAPSFVKETKSSDNCVATEYFRSSVQLAGEMLDGEATSSKHICHHDFSESKTEVSDQNFIADELIVGEKVSKICSKRKQRTELTREPINDQVVPSRKKHVTLSPAENHACETPVDVESTARTNARIASFLPTETETSSCKKQEVE